MKVNLNLQLNLMGSSLYRMMGARIGKAYEKAKSSHIFQYFIDSRSSRTKADN
jgi:hypothetical protein